MKSMGRVPSRASEACARFCSSIICGGKNPALEEKLRSLRSPSSTVLSELLPSMQNSESGIKPPECGEEQARSPGPMLVGRRGQAGTQQADSSSMCSPGVPGRAQKDWAALSERKCPLCLSSTWVTMYQRYCGMDRAWAEGPLVLRTSNLKMRVNQNPGILRGSSEGRHRGQ